MPTSRDTPANISQNNSNSNTSSDSNAHYEKPKSIIVAVSEIQQYHVLEKGFENDLDKNFFTLSQVFDFASIGFKSGFLESLLFVSLLPLLQTIYPSFLFYFLNDPLTENELLLFNILSYLPIVLITIWLSSLARLYEGTITKKAIFSLLTGRSIAFVLKGIIIYFLFLYLYKLALENPEEVYIFIDYTKIIFDVCLPTDYTYSSDDLYEYYYKFIIPSLKITASNVLLSMCIFAFIPYITVIFKGTYRNYKKIKNEVSYELY